MSTYDTSAAGEPGATSPDTSKVQEKAQEAASVAGEKAQQAAGQARDRVRQQVDTRSTQAGEQAGTVAQDVRSVGEHLRSQGKDKPAELADKAAERVEQVGDYLKRSDGDTILRDVEQMGRDKPWAVMAGGMVLGIVASRFLKASSTRRYREMESSPYLPAGRADVGGPALSPPPATPPAPGTRGPVPGAPERELSLTGGVMPERPVTPGPGTSE